MTSYSVKKVDIMILNYNGEEILPKCLPSIVEASKKSPVPCQVIVLDNKSTDKSVEYIRKNFPQITLVIAKENKVLFSYNEHIPKLDSDVVILLNNDIKVDPDFIAPLISRFSSPDVFAVAPKQLNFNGIGHNGGKNKIEFKQGLMNAGCFYEDSDPVLEKSGYTYYNANSAYNRAKFIELGGFDDIFSPFTWEDTDLGYRALKAGYKFVYEPKSVIYHNESYTVDKESKNIRNRSVIRKRNSFIFTWKNITSPSILAIHLMLLPFNFIRSLLYDRNQTLGLIEAVGTLSKVLNRRSLQKKSFKLRDEEVLTLE